MPPKKSKRSSNDMHSQTYYLSNTPLYNYYPPPDQHKYIPNYNQSISNQAPLMTAHEEAEKGAFLLQSLKGTQQENQLPPGQNQTTNNNHFPLKKKLNNQNQKVFIHRIGRDSLKLNHIESNQRNNQSDDKNHQKREIYDFPVKPKPPTDVNELNNQIYQYDESKPNTKFSNADIIFANGNNREKRRIELFENYSELYKFKEFKRKSLFEEQSQLLQKNIDYLNKPNNFNTEISDLPSQGKKTPLIIRNLFEKETDIIETRDYELTRLRYWRRYKRNENIKNYYKQSLSLHQGYTDDVIDKLEKLKNFLLKQKTMLKNLDKDLLDINSNRSEKFYSGFKSNESGTGSIDINSDHDQNQNGNGNGSNHGINGIQNSSRSTPEQESLSNIESSETDTQSLLSTNTNTKPKKPSQSRKKITKPNKKLQSKQSKNQSIILTSILEGFAPLLTNEEFQIITNDESRSSKPSSSSNLTLGLGLGSDTEHGEESGTGRTTTSSRAVREARDREGYKDGNAATLNKIMKQYTSPNELDELEIESDLKILRSGK
ncbi:hypothetical protein BN7_6174 [Wickerhamomyces ciferrii]|uniref:Uncharacterized protein n=1 Tax=Wickerhamomyces ciferrii (strain ATCC 14091 / BCRC 22168 / CBS 111 / JCM 3599 / NBRC 0793 / NRRL Y-1031 F-60-10) TaxID=1206466 RepID=K0KTS3_WICCF|nr:uncharacterized protein BN7_6174 [Wickerhamomyces ciferrii]CCH46581.1 hypothetical protein BN7_6174 [Wickerhamomyces ciferrii]